MANQERTIVASLVLLMIVLWGGFVWHSSPRFPGSFSGSMLGIIAAFLLFFPLIYLVIKRNKSIKSWVTKKVSMSTLLVWHIYAGVIGPIIGLLHSAHRFDSLLGILLVLLMMLVAISGFIGRYILSLISSKLKDKKKLKEELKNELKDEQIELHERFCSKHINAIPSDLNSHSPSLFSSSLGLGRTSNERRILRLVDAISDIEYSIRIHDTAKLWFKRWLKFHISISMILYVLIIFHITAEIYFGLRWL
ncbi:MAG: hypothetical protein V7736_01290 [Colwellia polaris]|jgi:hypothetical protein